jgi:DNA-binding transcriptional LysR family regulator
MLLPGVLHRVEDVAGLTVICSDQDPLLPDFADLTPDHDIVVADAPGVLPAWRERGLVITELMREPLDIALPEGHPLAAKSELTPSDVIGERWVGVPDSLPFDRILQRIEAITGLQANVVQRFIDNGIAESMVAAGHGIAILPRFTTRDHENGLVTRPLAGIRSERVIWAIQRPEVVARPSVRLVLQALRDEAHEFLLLHDR